MTFPRPWQKPKPRCARCGKELVRTYHLTYLGNLCHVCAMIMDKGAPLVVREEARP